MNNQCPYCKSEKIEEVVIRFRYGQEQSVNLCQSCKKIFKKGIENEEI